MINATVDVPTPVNEPVLSYAPGSPEREALKSTLDRLSRETLELPLIIGGKEARRGARAGPRCPHRHSQVLARYHKAGAAEVSAAIAAAREAHGPWSRLPWQHRAAVFLRAA